MAEVAGKDGGLIGLATVDAPLPEEFTAETGYRTFQLIDLGVLPGLRGRGIGRALTEAVLAGCGAERAALAVEPRLAANQRLYRFWGWRKAGRIAAPPSAISDVDDIYLLEELPGLAEPPGAQGIP